MQWQDKHRCVASSICWNQTLDTIWRTSRGFCDRRHSRYNVTVSSDSAEPPEEYAWPITIDNAFLARQQYGNMEEAASVARTPDTCLEVWPGDHRQTSGGLKKSKEAKAFRKKLTKRPLALRGQTQYTQAHDLGDIAMRYLDCPEGTFPWKIRQLLTDNSTANDPAVVQVWHDLIGDSPPCFSSEIHRAAFAILWMGLRGFFFLHCRASTEPGRSTSRKAIAKESETWNTSKPSKQKQKPNKKHTQNKPNQQTQLGQWKLAKGETKMPP